MKHLFPILLFPAMLSSQTYQLTVQNGHGSGQYAAGDTVHVYAAAWEEDDYFISWSGDTESVRQVENWHTTVIMPAAAVELTANLGTHVADYELLMIQGKDIEKPVYLSIPDNPVGLIYFCHGTNGSASNLASGRVEINHFTRTALANGFAILITEAEEVTTGIDADGNGKLRWQTFPFTTDTNIDFANIDIITQTLIDEGRFSASLPRFAAGISNGGYFAQSLAFGLELDGAVSFIGPGITALYDGVPAIEMNRPCMWVLSQNDSNEEIGSEGVAIGRSHYERLVEQNIPTAFIEHTPYPLYPQRFERLGAGTGFSLSIFNELNNNGQLDESLRPLHNAATLAENISANSSNYPILSSLNSIQLLGIGNQWDIHYADHTFYDDYNGDVMVFLRSLLNTTNTTAPSNIVHFTVYPNPSTKQVFLPTALAGQVITITNTAGSVVLNTVLTDSSLDLSSLPNGLYFLRAVVNQKVWIAPVVKEE